MVGDVGEGFDGGFLLFFLAIFFDGADDVGSSNCALKLEVQSEDWCGAIVKSVFSR